MREAPPTRLLVFCSRPGEDSAGRGEVLRLAAAVRDWDLALDKAEQEGLLPLLYWGLRDDPGAVPGAVLVKLRRAFLRNLARTTQVYRELELFLEAVRQSGLRAALTKGARLALEIYPEAALRPFWDVDFIVHPADWAGVRHTLLALDFVEAGGGAEAAPAGPAPPLDWSYSPYFKKGPIFLEFHASPLGLHFPSRGEDGLWTSAGRLRVRGTEAMLLPSESELCYLCVHAQQHSYQKLIWLSDIARLAGRPGLDWDWVCRIAHDERIRGPVFYSLHLAAVLWPGTVPPEPLRALRPGPFESAGLRLLWPEGQTAARDKAPAWPYYMPSIFSLWERRNPGLAARVMGQIFFPPKTWLAAATGVAAASPRLYGRYVERVLRPFLTAARRMLKTK